MSEPLEEENFSRWMISAQAGNREDYERLLKSMSFKLKSFFSKRASTQSAVDDLIQDTLLSVHQARHTYSPPRPFLPWMFAIANHRLVDYFRKEGRKQKREFNAEEIADFAIEDESHEALSFELSEELHEALDQLPENQKQIVMALKVEGLSVREVAERLELSESNVKVIASRAYRVLRERMRNREHG